MLTILACDSPLHGFLECALASGAAGATVYFGLVRTFLRRFIRPTPPKE